MEAGKTIFIEKCRRNKYTGIKDAKDVCYLKI